MKGPEEEAWNYASEKLGILRGEGETVWSEVGGGEKNQLDWYILCRMAGAPVETTKRAVSAGPPGART